MRYSAQYTRAATNASGGAGANLSAARAGANLSAATDPVGMSTNVRQTAPDKRTGMKLVRLPLLISVSCSRMHAVPSKSFCRLQATKLLLYFRKYLDTSRVTLW
jgi:hypothetical protein